MMKSKQAYFGKKKKKEGISRDLQELEPIQEDIPFVDSSKRTEVQLFPNRYSLITKTYELKEAEEPSDLYIKEFPSTPVEGSFWVTLSEGNTLFDYKLENSTTTTNSTRLHYFNSILETIGANLDKKLTLTMVNRNYNQNDKESEPFEEVECIVKSVNDYHIVYEVDGISHFEPLSQVKSLSGKDLVFSQNRSRTSTSTQQSIKINYVGTGGEFKVCYLVNTASYSISYYLKLDQEKHKYQFSNKLTIKCLSNGLDHVNSLKLMGPTNLQTSYEEFLFTGNKGIYYQNNETVDTEALFQKRRQVEKSLTKMYYDIPDISLPKDMTNAITLLDNINGEFDDIYLVDSCKVDRGKIPVFHAVKFNNQSEFCFMKGNALITDLHGIFITQSCIKHTDKGEDCFIVTGQCNNIDVSMEVQPIEVKKDRNDKKSEFDKKKYKCKLMVKSEFEQEVKIQLKHEIEGKITSISKEATESQVYLEEGEINSTNKLSWVLSCLKMKIEIDLEYEVLSRKKGKNKGRRNYSDDEDEEYNCGEDYEEEEEEE